MKQLTLLRRTPSQTEHGGSLQVGKRRRRRPLVLKNSHHLVLRSDYAYGSRSLLRHRPQIEKIIKKAAQNFQVKVYQKSVVSNHIHLLVKGETRVGLQNFFRVVAGHIAQHILRSHPILAHEKPKPGGAPRGAIAANAEVAKQTEKSGRRLSEGAEKRLGNGAEKRLGKGAERRQNEGAERRLSKGAGPAGRENKFWEFRIYSKIVGWGKHFLATKKYIALNTFETMGLLPYQGRNERKNRKHYSSLRIYNTS